MPIFTIKAVTVFPKTIKPPTLGLTDCLLIIQLTQNGIINVDKNSLKQKLKNAFNENL
jgi:hypothetical protein